MKKRTISKILIIILALDVILSGIMFLFGPNIGVDMFKDLIERLGYPQYVLGVLGIGKILIGLGIFIPKSFLIRTYAYFALFINLFLAIYSHISVGDAFADAAPASMLMLFGGLVFWLDYKTSVESQTHKNEIRTPWALDK